MPFQPVLLPLVLILGLAAGCRPGEGPEPGLDPAVDPGLGDAVAPLPGAPDPCAAVDLQEGYLCIADPAAPGGVRIEPAP